MLLFEGICNFKFFFFYVKVILEILNLTHVSIIWHIQCSPLITLCVISELSFKREILQRNYRKMTILWSIIGK